MKKKGYTVVIHMNECSYVQLIKGVYMHNNKCCIGEEDNRLEALKSLMPEENQLFELADFFKVFGDSTRIKIICTLFNGEMCVGTIANVLDMSQSSISHQLRVLKSSRLVKARKEGKQVFYSLDDMHVEEIYHMGIEHIKGK